MADFSEVKEIAQAKIKVVGLGGAGCNAICSMIESQEFQDIDFIVANTDSQALDKACAKIKVQLGRKITKGLGAGSNPETGRRAAEEDVESIKEVISGADIVFLTAGLGGGTGSGAIPIFAKIAKEMGVLTVSVVTKPFAFEGKRRMVQALGALESLAQHTDTIIVVPNEKLIEMFDPKISMLEAFSKSNNILKQAVKGISDIIQKTGVVNVDFADVKSIMKEMGLGIMGTARASGPDRAKKAAIEAINSPLLENISIQGARGVLVNITGNIDIGLHEINDAAEVIHGLVSPDANIILGSVIDPQMQDEIMVTVIATGLEEKACQKVFGSKVVEQENRSGGSLFTAGSILVSK